MMRTRTTIVPGACCRVQQTTGVIYYAGGSVYDTRKPTWDGKASYKDTNYVSLYEMASDLPSGSTRSNWNGFEHYKRWIPKPPIPMSLVVPNWGFLASSGYYEESTVESSLWGCNPWASWKNTAFGSFDNPIVGLPRLVGIGPEIVNLPSNYRDYVEEAIKFFLPNIAPEVNPEVSMINAIIELKDFKHLPKLAVKMQSFMKHILSKGWSPSSTIKQLLHLGADTNLTYQFGIAPMIGDISGFHRALRKARKRAKALLSLEGKTFKRHFNCPMNAAFPYDEKSASGSSLQYWCKGTQTCSNSTSMNVLGTTTVTRQAYTHFAHFHAEIEYNVYFSQYQRENATLLTLLDQIGLNFNPRILWDATPFSFLVDWVAKVGNYVNQFKMEHMEPLVIVKRFLSSMSVYRSIHLNQRFSGPASGAGTKGMSLPVFHESAYRRVVGIPSYYSTVVRDLEVAGLSLRKVSLLSSLLYSRKPGRPS